MLKLPPTPPIAPPDVPPPTPPPPIPPAPPAAPPVEIPPAFITCEKKITLFNTFEFGVFEFLMIIQDRRCFLHFRTFDSEVFHCAGNEQ